MSVLAPCVYHSCWRLLATAGCSALELFEHICGIYTIFHTIFANHLMVEMTFCGDDPLGRSSCSKQPLGTRVCCSLLPGVLLIFSLRCVVCGLAVCYCSV